MGVFCYSKDMNRLGAILSFIFVAAFLFAGLGSSVAEAASTQNFKFNRFHADYFLSKDNEGRSNLKVVETLEAVFPNFNQNKGIYRSIPNTYDGHSVSVDIVSLTRNGQPEPIYDREVSRGHLIISTGDDNYVTGNQTYQLTYTLRDVVKDFGTHQEFYWDINGFDWQQSFGNVSATIHLDESIAGSFNDKTACYIGVQGSNTSCGGALKIGDSIEFSSNSIVRPGNNLTVVMGFQEGTFAPYDEGFIGVVRPYVIGSMFALTLIIIVGALYLGQRHGRDAKGRGIIVPQYLAPKDPVRFSASLVGRDHKFMTAQIVSLAVNRNIKIVEIEKPGLFKRNKVYAAELASTEGMNQDELNISQILFSGHAVGSRYEFSRSSGAIEMKLGRVTRLTTTESVAYGYRRSTDIKITTLRLVFMITWVALVVLSFILLPHDDGSVARMLLMLSIIFAAGLVFMAMMALLTRRPLTEKGVQLRDYLKGLDMYIKLAEADRFRVLHSVEGAERVPINTNDKEQMIKMYEKLLPYAILFGHEKSWSKQLEVYYAETNTVPAWYVGASGVFNVASFSSAISSVSAAVSSSSSGLSGGGSSGGGGGGGGGGGR